MVSFQDISKNFMLVAKQFIDNTMDGTSQVFVGLTVIMLVVREKRRVNHAYGC